jgi:hypothetical protein
MSMTKAQEQFARDLVDELRKDFSSAAVHRVAAARGWIVTREGTLDQVAGVPRLVGWTFDIAPECKRINTQGGAA